MDEPAFAFETDAAPEPWSALTADLPAEVIEPILAGVRARRVAERCEAANIAAVLVDAAGRVLHLASRVTAFMGQGIDLAEDHLVGLTRADNAALERALTASLAPADDEAHRPCDDKAAYRIIGLPYRDASPYQMLRGVLVFRAPDEALDEHELRALLCT